MATGEKSEDSQKDKATHSEEQEKKPSKDIQDKVIEKEDLKNAGETFESEKNEAVIEEVKKVNEAETREIVVEDKKEKAELGEVVVEEEKKNDQVKEGDVSESTTVDKNSSDLKEHERRALMELRSKIEKAILEKKLLKENENQVVRHEKEKILEKEVGEIEEDVKETEKEKETSEKVEEIEDKEKILEMEDGEEKKVMENVGKGEANAVKETEKEKEACKKVEESEAGKTSVEESKVVKEDNKASKKEDEEKAEEGQKENNNVAIDKERKVDVINKDISIWGVPLFPSKGDNRTDVILLKFLKAREFEVNDAFEMLRNALQWRKDNKIDSILDEDFGDDLSTIRHMIGVGREGQPVCYSSFKMLGDEEVYNKILGTDEKREKFIRWRVQLLEKTIHMLDFNPGGMSSILLVNDLKEMPGPSKKELRLVTKQVVALLQDNYPEFVARNIFINVPFWYYAFSASALLTPFLTQRTNSKFVFARPSRVTEVLLKYIAAEELPVHYGGLKRENDSDFSAEDAVSEITVHQSSSETIQISAPEAGSSLTWEVTVFGWEVNYKEEFFPTDEGSYGIIISKGRRINAVQEGPLRNSFTNNEPGNVVLTIENGSMIKKKRLCYRYKIKNSCSSS